MTVDLRNWGDGAAELHERLTYLDQELFAEYVPAKDDAAFGKRLRDWLTSAGDEADRRQLFSLLEHLYFVGQKELDVLYQQAFRSEVMWWLSPPSLSLGDAGFKEALKTAIEETWFCPITDSMNIAHFHHVNKIRDRNLRPEWRALERFGDDARVSEYMEQRGFTRIMLLEDFVGTGNQAFDAIRWTIEKFPDTPLLVCPLIICQAGFERLGELLDSASGSATLRPGLVLSEKCELGPPERAGEPEDFKDLRSLLLRLIALVGADGADDDEKAFGFGAVGALSVLFTNCPNNVPPALHYSDSQTWRPLFPRAIRI